MTIPRRDLDFQVFEVLDGEGLRRFPRYAEHDREVFDGVIDSAYRIAEDRFAPFAAACDVEEPRVVDGRVWMIPETQQAFAAYNEASFTAASFDAEDGGMQLPLLIAKATSAVFSSANVAFHSYSTLTAGAANLLISFGNQDQRVRLARPMLAGRFTGTMCLSEPHAGSSLTDIRCQALPQDDGSYRLTGSKMWISGGDHELAETIVHLVLAKIPGGPPGVRGISLFAVPRNHVDSDGTVGAGNDVRLAGINHKMGWRGTVNCVLSFGEQGQCRAELVGLPHHGLEYMFQMMNAARLGVGMNAVALGYAGYMHALAYARERPQGRSLSARDPTLPPVPILRHGDVRRMLLSQKCWVEGGLALVLYCAQVSDEERCAEDPAAKAKLNLLLELLTPIAKSWPSEFCLEANKLAIQVLGGYGYTRDYPVERLYRDNRLNHIHEGTHGIHGLDLLGRKVSLQGGGAMRELAVRIGETISVASADKNLAEHADSLAAAFADIGKTTEILVAAMAKDPERALANATLYLDSLGHVVVAWRWLAQGIAARRAQGRQADRDFYAGKLAACRFFFRCELPRVTRKLALLRSLDDTALTIPDSGF